MMAEPTQTMAILAFMAILAIANVADPGTFPLAPRFI
jgi:hypothetical protein